MTINFKTPTSTEPTTEKIEPKISFGSNTVHTSVTAHAEYNSKPKSLFGGDPNLDRVMSYIEINYNSLFVSNDKRLRAMVKQIIPCELPTIISWGDDALVEQKNIVGVVSSRMQEFNALNGNELLSEVLNSGKTSQHGLISKLLSIGKTTDSYSSRINSLKVHLTGLLSPILQNIDKIKSSTLPLYAISIAAVGEVIKPTDDLVEEALLNRRKLLYQANQNLQVAEAQLVQVKELIIKMQTEIDYIINVVLPATLLNK
jgi:hypothetical protein